MKDINKELWNHWDEAREHFDTKQIVGLFLQGSQNYNLATKYSDIDTKLIVVPSFKDIAMNHKPVSTTHIRANEEHIDFKDIRLYMETFRKQNLNFLEILFTVYFLINEKYASEWYRLVNEREMIARMNPVRAVKSMKGIAMEKFHAMKHPYPSKLAILEKFGYDPKQLHHLLRVEEYLERYISGERYADCLITEMKDYLIDVKFGYYPAEEADVVAEKAIAHVNEMTNKFCEVHPEVENPYALELLRDVQYNIMKIAVKNELGA